MEVVDIYIETRASGLVLLVVEVVFVSMEYIKITQFSFRDQLIFIYPDKV